MIATGMRNQDVFNWISNIQNSDFANNLIKGNNGKEIVSSWLTVIGIAFYLVWSIQNDTWVDPGVYSVMIAMVAFGIALNINSKVEN
jgi:hypothetical protein